MAKKVQRAVGEIPNLAEIVALAHQMLVQQALVADLETSLAAQKAMLRETQEEDLPAAMKEAGLKEFVLDTGEKLTIKEDFSVGIPAARRAEAFDWLTEEGFAGLIKTHVVVAFGKGELEKAERLVVALAKKNLEVVMDRDVHWQTLKAFVSERVREAKPIPMDLFGAVPVDKAIIKAPKRKDE